MMRRRANATATINTNISDNNTEQQNFQMYSKNNRRRFQDNQSYEEGYSFTDSQPIHSTVVRNDAGRRAQQRQQQQR
jgi:hypothetical protein